jgi:formylglycine-generating enzyme required for sulfatase activity
VIPAGRYTIGCNSPDATICPSDAQPAHPVEIAAIYLDRYEVTAGAYQACVATGGCTQGLASFTQAADEPVVGVTWDQARAFCAYHGMLIGSSGGRLPTEAEWEIAAHGLPDATSEGSLYPWGATPPPADCSFAVSSDCTPLGLRPIKQRPKGASPYGLEDLSGNAEEWVQDGYSAQTYSLDAAAGVVSNPQGPPPAAMATERVKRGGSFNEPAAGLGLFMRYSATPDSYFDFVGFRCAYLPPL